MARTIPGYPDPRNLVTLPAQRVTWKGQEVTASEVEVTRSLGTSLPGSVSGVDDLVAATGSARWKLTDDLVDTGLHLPWLNPNQPVKGDPVTVDLGLGDSKPRALTGVLDEPDGNVSDGYVSSSLVDDLDRFKLTFSMDPVYWRHPSPIAGAPLMDPGMHPAFVTDRILRRCGFYATPPRSTGGFFSAPMMGSLWPEHGVMEFGRSHEDRPGSIRDTQPEFDITTFGMALLSGSTRYRPTTSSAVHNKPLYFHWLSGPVRGSGAIRRRTDFTNGASWAIWQGASAGQVSLIMNNDDGTQAGERIFTLPAGVDTRAINEFSIWINPHSGAVAFRCNDATFNASFPFITTLNSAVAMSSVQVDTNVMWGAGFKSGLAAQFDLHDWTPSAFLEVNGEEHQQLSVVPAIIEENCLALLKSQAKSELAGMWIDEEGAFRYRSRDRLMGAQPSWELTLDDMSALSWSGAPAASEAVVKWRRPRTTPSNRPWFTAYEESTVTIARGDVWEKIVHPDADTDWINVAPLGVLSTASGEQDFNEGVGSWIAGVIEFDDDDDDALTVSAASYLLGPEGGPQRATMTKLDARSYLLRVDGSDLAAGTQLVLRTADWSGLKKSKRSLQTPILRAYAVTQWADETTTGLPLGTSGATPYPHESGWWIQNDTFAQRIADWIARDLTAARAMMRSLSVTPDDRRQIGDIALVHLPGMTLKCLCVSDKKTATPGKRTQTLALQVIEIQEAN